MSTPKLRECYEIESKYEAFYTGGNIEWHDTTLYCHTDNAINLVDLNTGIINKKISEVDLDNPDWIQTFTTDNRIVVTSHKSGLIKQWTLTGELVRTWKSIHRGPIVALRLNSENFLASGGSDGTVRLWDLVQKTCRAVLRGCQGVVNLVEFHGTHIFASGDDGKLHSWILSENAVQPSTMYSAHFSKITSMVFGHDGQHFVTCGRDRVIMLWQIGNGTPLKTLPLHESVECIVGPPIKFKLPNRTIEKDVVYILTAGDGGEIKVWDMTHGRILHREPLKKDTIITRMLIDAKTKSFVCITAEQNLLFFYLKSFINYKQLVGFSDEILDVCFVGDNDSHLAVATNSKAIKLYDATTMDCRLLDGHDDLVLTLAVPAANRNLLFSGAKDHSVRLWLLDGGVMRCVAMGMRHTSAIGSVACFNENHSTAASVGRDNCLKLWTLPKSFSTDVVQLDCNSTCIAHTKDINYVTVSPNDRLIATASQDKTTKLWNSQTLAPIGSLRGHKRGVWCARFSPIDQVIATSSADCTVKLWSVADLSCLKTLEGHDSSVLKLDFLTSTGLQLITAGGDGLLKIFTIKTSECAITLDAHEGKIWALAVSGNGDGLVTGGADSVLVRWRDITAQRANERAAEQDASIVDEQRLVNCVRAGHHQKALRLALKLDRPMQALRILERIIINDQHLEQIIRELKHELKEKLAKYVVEWNTNSKNAQTAQYVLNALLNECRDGDLRVNGLGRFIEENLPYTERHFKRLTNLMQDLHFIDYTITCMQPYNKSD